MGVSSSSSSGSSNSNQLEPLSLEEIYRNIKDNTRDIEHVKVKQMHFATCPIRGWFVEHWAIIMEREDGKFIAIQFVKSGLEVERSNTFVRAKDSVARCSLTAVENVQTKRIGTTGLTIGELVEAANSLSREYNFITYNCRHFVVDFLKIIKRQSF